MSRGFKAERLLCALAAFGFAAGFLLTPAPSDPDQPLALPARLTIALYFLGWAASLVSWGRVGARLLRQPTHLLEWVSIGTLGASGAALGLGYAGLIGREARPIVFALSLLGPVLDLYVSQKDRPGADTKNAARSPRVLAAVAGLSLLGLALEALSRVNGALIPHFHSDVLVYHLYGPRLWFEAGRIAFSPLDAVTLQCSYWESLAIWANGFLAGPGGGGLIDALVFMQLAHAVLGFAATALALERLFAALDLPEAWRLAAAFAGLTSGLLGWTAWLAKNDWGLTFWLVAGLAFLVEASRKASSRTSLKNAHATRARATLGGALLGAAIGNKVVLGLSLLWLAFAMLLLLLKARRGDRGTLAYATAAFVPACFAPFLRSAWTTGNPFFPAADAVFPSHWLTSSQRALLASAQRSPLGELGHLSWARAQLLARQDPFVLAAATAALALVGVSVVRRKAPAPATWLAASLLPCLVQFFITVGPIPGVDDLTLRMRYLGPLLPLAPGFALVLAWQLGARRLTPRAQAAVLVAVLAIAASRFQFPIVVERLSPTEAFRVAARGGESKAWLRMNARPGELIATTGDLELYPLAHLGAISMRQAPLLDDIGHELTRPGDLILALRQLGFKWLLDVKSPEGLWWGAAAPTLDAAVGPHPDAIAFQGGQSYVVDLTRLGDDLLAACVDPDAPLAIERRVLENLY